GFRFAAEAGDLLVGRIAAMPDDLQRDRAPEVGLLGEGDHAHATLADLAQERVLADSPRQSARRVRAAPRGPDTRSGLSADPDRRAGQGLEDLLTREARLKVRQDFALALRGQRISQEVFECGTIRADSHFGSSLSCHSISSRSICCTLLLALNTVPTCMCR